MSLHVIDNDSPGVTIQWKLERCSYRDATIVSSYLAETEDTRLAEYDNTAMFICYTDVKVVILPMWMNSYY